MGRHALLVECDPDETIGLYRALRALRWPGLTDIVAAASTLLVRFSNPAQGNLLSDLLGSLQPETEASKRRHLTVQVVYDGADLAEVAHLTGLSQDEVIQRHTAAEYTVAFMGFAPGFGYLSGGDPRLLVPRRATPRTQIPAGAVALAGAYTGVYPRVSPGGWQLIGRTAQTWWDDNLMPPSLLLPGDVVRFQSVSELEPSATSPPVVTTDGALQVVCPGRATTVQDGGRSGWAHLGVGPSGAADTSSLARANAVVGNSASALAFETGGGLEIEALQELRLGLCDGQEHEWVLQPGQRCRICPPETGAYSYLAVAGGLLAPRVLGSAATDVLGGLGTWVRAGLKIGLGTGFGQPFWSPPTPRPYPGQLVELAVSLGPRHSWLAAGGWSNLLNQVWTVTPHSNRIGTRLAGRPLELSRQDPLPSEPMIRGAIQVPGDGQPIILGPDHPVTGGYPVVACVSERDWNLLGQLPVGAAVRFVWDGP